MKYLCDDCYRGVHEADAVWKLPNRAIMTMDINVLREQMDGPYCPHCGSANVRENPPTGDANE